MKERNIWDRGRWRFVKEIKFDFMTRYIYEHISKYVSFKNKTSLELGAGLGRLSYLALNDDPKKVTLIENSTKALELSKKLFTNISQEKYKIINEGILNISTEYKADIVFSSGVIEHFRENERFEIIKKHVELSKQECVIVHPTDNICQRIFNKFPLSVKMYGFQKSFSEGEINKYLESLSEIKNYTHFKFHTFYTVPLLHNNEKINRIFDKKKFFNLTPNLTITHIKKN